MGGPKVTLAVCPSKDFRQCPGRCLPPAPGTRILTTMSDPIRLTRPRARLFLFLPLIAISWVAPAAAQDCYESVVRTPSPFMGNNGEMFQLADGSLWEVKYVQDNVWEHLRSGWADPAACAGTATCCDGPTKRKHL